MAAQRQNNNRIPSSVRDFSGKPEVTNTKEFLDFKDWQFEQETKAKDWIIVARHQITPTSHGESNLFTYSALAEASNDSLKKLLSKPEWDVDMELGQPTFYTKGFGGSVLYDSGTTLEKNGIVFRPFVLHRFFNDYVPTVYQLVQNFILYHNAFFVSDKSEYQRIDDDGEIHSVVRIVVEGKNQVVLVDAHHLKDYLAANKCYLVRYHDHLRHTMDEIDGLTKGEPIRESLAGDTWSFQLTISADSFLGEWKTLSWLHGKDVVFPYSEPDRSHTSFARQESDKEFAKFIIARDQKGNEVESTCNDDELSNYFVDRGTPHALTPVYFKREVLSKYYQEPRRFEVTDSEVNCLGIWGITFDITDEGLVQVWLYHLGHLPYKEQVYWRGFNVVPKGTITAHRWKRDFLAEFADSKDPVLHFKEAFNELQVRYTTEYGAPLFRKLDEMDKHVLGTLHVPLTEEQKEFDEQIQSLAKVVVDSLNVQLLSSQTGQEIDGATVKGSIGLLAVFLKKIGLPEEERVQVSDALSAVQSIRSSGVAHRKGEKFHETLKRFGLEGLSNQDKMERLPVNLTSALLLLNQTMKPKS
jgi:hypothetical protein